jgi:RNA polymerase sigma-70 factor, ECF subfamily
LPDGADFIKMASNIAKSDPNPPLAESSNSGADRGNSRLPNHLATAGVSNCMADGGADDLEYYVQELIACQGRLRAYIAAALGNYANSADVLQRTNLVLWKKAGEFRAGEEFMPWALTVARYEVLAFLRDHRRDRHVFCEDVATMMLDAFATEVSDPGDRETALRKCLDRLPSRSRKLLWQRYDQAKSIKQIASETGRSENSVKCHFVRLRKSLERCIEGFLKTCAV